MLEWKEQIRDKLKQAGYTNKLITYTEFLELYEPYKENISEIEFAEVLGITYGNLARIKYQGGRAKILKEKTKITQVGKENIIQALLAKGYKNTAITYEEFLELYKPYQLELKETEFIDILGISYNNFQSMKHRGTRAVIFKEENTITKRKKEEIIQVVKEKGYTNTSITYEEFLELYTPYTLEMKETEFAEIVGISYANLKNIQHRGHRTKILKEENTIPQEKKQEIIQTLQKKGYKNTLIAYTEFLELYEPYALEMKENEFADLLGIAYYNFVRIKNKGKARILKDGKDITDEKQQKIIQDLQEKGYTNKMITYAEFLELYEPYKLEIKEKEFANNILGISYPQFQNLKYKGQRAKILKEEKKISQERKQEMIQTLHEKGYKNTSINYTEFLELYEPYKSEMKENEFADLLGIAYYNLMSIKRRNNRTKILKEEKEITLERKKQILQKLQEKGYKNTSITYTEFLELYESYKSEMKEAEFANILGISEPCYNSIKYKGTKTKIYKEEITPDKKQKIIQALKEKGYTNKLITYTEFFELYEPYKLEMKKMEFASLLGISHSNFWNMKNQGTRARIQFQYKDITRVAYVLQREARYYTMEEIESLCKENKVTVEEVLTQIFHSPHYAQRLLQKESLYIGKCAISKEFQEQYAEKLWKDIQQISRRKSYKYNFHSEHEDIASECFLHLIENKGDIIKNSNNDEEAMQNITKYASVWIKYRYVLKCNVRGKIYSLDEDVIRKENIERYSRNKQKEETEYEPIPTDKTPLIEQLQQYHEEGLSSNDAIAHILDTYKIEKRELLDILEEELAKKRRIVKKEDGSVYLGEEIE